MLTWPYTDIEMGVWMPLLGSGIGFTFPSGTTLQDFLENRFKVAPHYLEQRIQTILVNSRAIDCPDQVYLHHGDVVALSAAMPGLAGTTLRRGSHLATMRGDITRNPESSVAQDRGTRIVTLKLFNMVAAELGPRVLTGRILVKKRDMHHLRRCYASLPISATIGSSGDWIDVRLPDRPSSGV